MSTRPIATRRKAFTLLEVLVAGAIVVLVVSSSAAASRTIQLNSSRSAELSRMDALAADGMDELKSLSGTDVQAVVSPTPSVAYFEWTGCVDTKAYVTVDFPSLRFSTNYDSVASYDHSCDQVAFPAGGSYESNDGYRGFGTFSVDAAALPGACSSYSITDQTAQDENNLYPGGVTLIPNTNTVKVDDSAGSGSSVYSFRLACTYSRTASVYHGYDGFSPQSPLSGGTGMVSTFTWDGCVDRKGNVMIDFAAQSFSSYGTGGSNCVGATISQGVFNGNAIISRGACASYDLNYSVINRGTSWSSTSGTRNWGVKGRVGLFEGGPSLLIDDETPMTDGAGQYHVVLTCHYKEPAIPFSSLADGSGSYGYVTFSGTQPTWHIISSKSNVGLWEDLSVDGTNYKRALAVTRDSATPGKYLLTAHIINPATGAKASQSMVVTDWK